MVETKHGPMFVRCTLCAKVLCTTCATPVMALKGTSFDTEGVIEAQAAASQAAATEDTRCGHAGGRWNPSRTNLGPGGRSPCGGARPRGTAGPRTRDVPSERGAPR